MTVMACKAYSKSEKERIEETIKVEKIQTLGENFYFATKKITREASFSAFAFAFAFGFFVRND